VGLAYLAFTYFVPIRQQPTSLTEAHTLPLIQSSAEVLLTLAPSRDYADFAMPSPGQRDGHPDALGDLIRRNGEVNKVSDSAASGDHVQHKSISSAQAKKGYGAKDRRALDSLLEATGNGGNGKP